MGYVRAPRLLFAGWIDANQSVVIRRSDGEPRFFVKRDAVETVRILRCVMAVFTKSAVIVQAKSMDGIGPRRRQKDLAVRRERDAPDGRAKLTMPYLPPLGVKNVNRSRGGLFTGRAGGESLTII